MFDFIKKWLPGVSEKRRILGALNNTKTTAEQSVYPSLLMINAEAIEDGFWDEGIFEKSKLFIDLTKALKKQALGRQGWVDGQARQVDLNKHYLIDNLIIVNAGFTQKLDLLIRHVTKEFSDKLTQEALTFKQAEILKLHDYFSFGVDYLNKLVTGFLDDYTSIVKNGDKNTLLPGERKWLETQMGLFAQIAEIGIMKNTEFEKLLNSSSDVIISEVIDPEGNLDTIATQGIETAPISGFMPVIGTAIYALGKWGVEREHKKYESNKARKKLTELHIEKLRQQQSGENPDPAIQKQIEYYTKLVQDLEASIYKYEEKIGVV